MRLMQVMDSLGKGIIAGLIGTAAMTASSTLEARIRRRQPSTAPARATAKVLGIDKFQDDAAYNRFSNLAHWAYGTSWGIPRALLRALGLPPAVATAGHLVALWGTEQVTLPVLDIAPPLVFWKREEVAIDALHHLVYALATGIACDFLDGRGR